MDNKIFITLGSQKFQFNRLLKAVDKKKKKGTINAEDVFAQIGYSDYLPKKFSYKKFLDRDEFSTIMSKADIVITHGGTGASAAPGCGCPPALASRRPAGRPPAGRPPSDGPAGPR